MKFWHLPMWVTDLQKQPKQLNPEGWCGVWMGAKNTSRGIWTVSAAIWAMRRLVEGSDAKRQCERLNDLPRSPRPESFGSIRVAFWNPASTSTVSTTGDRQQFWWASALGVRSQPNLKGPERSSLAVGQVLPGPWICLTTGSLRVLQTLTGLLASRIKLGLFLWKGLGCFYSVS